MILKGLTDEDFVNYQKISMTLIMPHCDFKCDKENGCKVCQNSHLASVPEIFIDDDSLINRYLQNPLSCSICFAGLEPWLSINEVISFIDKLRFNYNCNDDIVIYTGYNKEELINTKEWNKLMGYPNIIIKFGRYRPNGQKHYDPILGVELANKEQYAEEFNR